MHVHINHVFCLDSIWGGLYSSRYMVVIKRSLTYARSAPIDQDWSCLLEEHAYFDQKKYDEMRERYKDSPSFTDDFFRHMSEKTTYRLRPEVMEWLKANVEDDPTGQKGFAVGTDSYNQNALEGFSIWFYRRRDAMKFIERWSRHKKPTSYFDYFKGISKELDLKTGKLKLVAESR